MILTRTQFAIHFELKQQGMGKRTSPLWEPEEHLRKHRATSFVCVRPIFTKEENAKADYWAWCQQHLQGRVRCYSSDDVAQEEWWGFTNPDDILFWMIRWA